MVPKIVKIDTLYLLGMGFYGDPFYSAGHWTEENEVGSLWKRFSRFMDHSPGLFHHKQFHDSLFEVWITTEETEKAGIVEVFVGGPVAVLDDIPLECIGKKLPAKEYAVFTLKGNDIASDWHRQIDTKWLPEAGYRRDTAFSFQVYDKRFKGMDKLDESEMDVYIPVVKI